MGRDIIQPPKDGGLYSIHHGGDGARTRLICGFLGCDSAEGNPVISTLPAALRLNVEEGGGGGVDPLDLPVRRGRGRRRPPGIGDRAGQAVGAALRGSRAALRRDPARGPDRLARRSARPPRRAGTGAAASRHDPRLDGRRAGPRGRPVAIGAGRALHAPDRRARRCTTSPTGACRSRRRSCGTRSASLAQVADLVGYGSEAAFSRAFKKAFGAAPATWRRSNS